MKNGVSFFSFSLDVNLKEACQQCANAGYDGVELVLSEAGSLNMKTTDKELLQIKQMVDDLGLSVSSIGAWNLWEHNMAGNDPKETTYAMDIVKKQVDCAAALKADSVLIVPGWVGTIFAPGIVNYDEAYVNAQNVLSKLAPYAADAKVNLAVENVGNKFLLSPLEMRRFLEEIGSDYVGAYFDVGNIIPIGYPDQWIRILGKKYLKKLHFCDYRADQIGMGAFVDLLAGDVDFSAVMQALHDIDYDDWITIEFLPNYKQFPYQSIINAKQSLNCIIDK